MAILDNLKVFSEWVHTTKTETLRQQVALFNAATNGALVLRNKANAGDFSDETYWKEIAGLVRRRNIAGSSAVTAVELAQLSDTAVKVAGGTPPINIPPSMFTWIGKNQEEGGAVIGKQLAVAEMADMLNTAVAAARAALSGTAAVNYDGSAATATFGALNKGAAKFGDRSGDIVCWLLHSKVLHDLYDVALANSANLFTFGDVKVVQDGFGRKFVVTDSASLYTVDGVSAGVDSYHTIGLVPGAAMVEDNGDFVDNVQWVNGSENILRSYQAEWTYNLGLKGYAWDKTNGGRSPSNAAIATASNWDQTTAEKKNLAGVLIKTR